MSIEVTSLSIPDIKIIRPPKFEDRRGFFSATYNKQEFQEAGLAFDFVQDNHSVSARVGTIRGLHYQGSPFAQAKLVQVVRGRILDVAVDIRKSSPTFGKWVAAEISAEGWNQMLIPIGFAHGICTLEPDTGIIYKATSYYAPKHDFGIRWDDPDLSIDWPFAPSEVTLSDKDKNQPLFKDVVHWFQ